MSPPLEADNHVRSVPFGLVTGGGFHIAPPPDAYYRPSLGPSDHDVKSRRTRGERRRHRKRRSDAVQFFKEDVAAAAQAARAWKADRTGVWCTERSAARLIGRCWQRSAGRPIAPSLNGPRPEAAVPSRPCLVHLGIDGRSRRRAMVAARFYSMQLNVAAWQAVTDAIQLPPPARRRGWRRAPLSLGSGERPRGRAVAARTLRLGVVLVEPTDHPFLKACLYNIAHAYGGPSAVTSTGVTVSTALYVFVGLSEASSGSRGGERDEGEGTSEARVREWLLGATAGGSWRGVNVRRLPRHYSWRRSNTALTSPWWYGQFRRRRNRGEVREGRGDAEGEDYIMTTQADVLLRHPFPWSLMTDAQVVYAGAPWRVPPVSVRGAEDATRRPTLVGNGGVSLRRVRSFERAAAAVGPAPASLPEDWWWSRRWSTPGDDVERRIRFASPQAEEHLPRRAERHPSGNVSAKHRRRRCGRSVVASPRAASLFASEYVPVAESAAYHGLWRLAFMTPLDVLTLLVNRSRLMAEERRVRDEVHSSGVEAIAGSGHRDDDCHLHPLDPLESVEGRRGGVGAGAPTERPEFTSATAGSIAGLPRYDVAMGYFPSEELLASLKALTV